MGSAPFTSREGGGDAATTAKLGQRSDATSAALLRTKEFFVRVRVWFPVSIAVAALVQERSEGAGGRMVYA
jgi:hypothetical protein